MEKEKNIISSNNERQENSAENVFEKRKEIVNALASNLESNPRVVAAFLAGADTNNSIDEYSDIDFDIVVSDTEDVDEVEKIVKETLEKFSPIKTELRFSSGDNTTIIHQFENISKFLHVDILYMTKADGINKSGVNILFDKQDAIKDIETSKDEIAEKIKNGVEMIEKYRELRETYVERELNRDHFLEAEDKYRFLILKKLVEALRLQYCPEKSGHDMKHIYADLPENIVLELENLSRVSSIDELKEKYTKANELLNKTINELK
jgi:hypothetical protein